MKKYFNKENITKVLMIFLIIQPIIDIYILFDSRVVDFFGFSPATIIRIIGVGILALSVLFFVLKVKKICISFITYGLIVGIYVILHHINATNFTSLVDGDFGYNIISELFYIIRMLIPLMMIMISYYLPINDNRLNKIINWLVMLISGSIVVTNILGISLGTYSKKMIMGNIFTWFIDKYNTYDYMSLASKGFFNDPNRIAALLILITPILFYCFIKKPNKSNTFMIFIQLLGMFMLGTKVSTIGFIGITCATLMIYYFFSFLKKEFDFNFRINNTLLITIIICFLLLPHSPAINRMNVDNNMYNNYENNVNNRKKENDSNIGKIEPKIIQNSKIVNISEYKEIIKDKKEEDKINLEGKTILKVDKVISDNILIPFIKDNYEKFSINPIFILESYPYQDDPFFWYNIMKLPISTRTNFRYIEKAMLDRVKEINNNPLDNWFGITFTRLGNIFDLERDFISHYYSLGIIGVIIFLSPYVLVPIICGILMLIKHKKHLNFKNTMLMLSICITLFAAFYSGNVMDGLIVTIILGSIIGMLLKNIFTREVEYKKVSIIIPTYNDSKTITQTFNSVKQQKYENWEIIVVDDGSTDETQKVIKEYIDKNKLEDKIIYIYEENQDQLNAVLTGLNYITGDYIMILHSDDILASQYTFSQSMDYFSNNDCDAIFGDLKIIDKSGKNKGVQKVCEYHIRKKILPLQLLWLGRNLYFDTAMFKKEIFISDVKENYLNWNMPFWLSYNPKPHMLNVNKVYFSLIKYRVFEENYINNEVGKLNVINGELRVITNLMKHYNIPKYKSQYKIFRIFNKLHMLWLYSPIYSSKETINKSEIVEFTLEKRFNNDYHKYQYLEALNNFYKNKCERTIKLNIKDIPIYYGKDMRVFDKLMINNKLDSQYIKIFEEMNKGFNKVIVSKKDYDKAIIIFKFLSIYNDINIVRE